MSYPKDQTIYRDWVAPLGKIEEWLSSDRRAGRASWLSEQVHMNTELERQLLRLMAVGICSRAREAGEEWSSVPIQLL